MNMGDQQVEGRSLVWGGGRVVFCALLLPGLPRPGVSNNSQVSALLQCLFMFKGDEGMHGTAWAVECTLQERGGCSDLFLQESRCTIEASCQWAVLIFLTLMEIGKFANNNSRYCLFIKAVIFFVSPNGMLFRLPVKIGLPGSVNVNQLNS